MLVLPLAACGPKSAPPTALESLTADLVLWEGPAPKGYEGFPVVETEGTLRRSEPPPLGDPAEWSRFAVDDVAIRGVGLESHLAPHVGRRVRVLGLPWNTVEAKPVRYVEPVKIIALADR